MTDRQIRVGDHDRDGVVARLAEQYAEGRLTFEEFETRVEQALSASTQEDLDVLTVDLPGSRRDGRVAERLLADSPAAVLPSPRPVWRVAERLLAVTGAAVLATVLLAWGIAQEQTPPSSVVVCGPYVDADCYWPAGVEPVDY